MGADCSKCFSSSKPDLESSSLMKPLQNRESSAISQAKISSILNESQISRSSTQPQTCKGPNLEQFKILKEAGQGAYGKVYKVENKDTGRVYAMKKLSKKKIFESGRLESLLTEKSILTKADHPFVVKLHYSFQNEEYAFLVMDYIGGGTLKKRLKKAGSFPVDTIRFYAAEILLGLGYLHDKLDVIYRDLKPENVLLDEDGHVSLCDFGLSRVAATGFSFCGTPEYFAPEMIEKKGHGKPVDLWCFGNLMYELYVGKPLFSDPEGNRDRLYRRILEEPIELPDDMDTDLKDLLTKLLERNPTDRLGFVSIEEIKRHPFFTPIQNWEQIYKRRTMPPFRPGQEPKIKFIGKGRDTMMPKSDGNIKAPSPGVQENLTD